VAALIKLETGIEPQLVVGGWGEFAVLLNDKTIVKRGLLKLPSDERVLSAVRDALRP
jgi:hypothetical protein